LLLLLTLMSPFHYLNYLRPLKPLCSNQTSLPERHLRFGGFPEPVVGGP
jgi:hypothetical protein